MISEISIYFDFKKIVLLHSSFVSSGDRNGLFTMCSTAEEFAKILVFFQSSRLKVLHIFSDDVNRLFELFAANYRLIDAAGGLVTNQKGQVLMIKRNGFWDLPKGKVDKGEEVQKAALREVEEECGVTNLQLKSFLTTTYHVYSIGGKSFLKRSFWYNMGSAGVVSLKPQVEENITEAKWVSLDELEPYLENTFGTIRDVFSAAGLP